MTDAVREPLVDGRMRNRKRRRTAAPAGRRAWLLIAVFFVLGARAPTAFAQASDASAPRKSVCVDAEVDGARALSYDCLNQQLAPTPGPAAAGASNPAETQAKAPSNQVGTFNYSAERNRFGSNWGKSVFPQRPAPMQPVPLR